MTAIKLDEQKRLEQVRGKQLSIGGGLRRIDRKPDSWQPIVGKRSETAYQERYNKGQQDKSFTLLDEGLVSRIGRIQLPE
jgi:hypothetical protein